MPDPKTNGASGASGSASACASAHFQTNAPARALSFFLRARERAPMMARPFQDALLTLSADAVSEMTGETESNP